MRVLLPPSETKRAGGAGRPLHVCGLHLPALASQREQTATALVDLAADPALAAKVLGLGPRQLGEIVHNAALRTSPTMAAVDRYTGVLFDALDPATLDADGRDWLARHVLIHSAPFGPVGALDAIPAYRLAAGASIPGLPPLRRVWADAVTTALATEESFILDLRSAAYVRLGPLPPGVPAMAPTVVSEGADGTVRALNHFNKHAKGAFVRALAEQRPDPANAAELSEWARAAGFTVRMAGAGWELVV